MREKMHNSYLVLQQRIGAIFDQDLDRTSDQRSLIPGIKQILEKKQVFLMSTHVRLSSQQLFILQ